MGGADGVDVRLVYCRAAEVAGRWLLKARSPLVKYRAAVDILGLSPAGDVAIGWWARRYEDADLAALAAAQTHDGGWFPPRFLYARRRSWLVPRYLAAAWQFPLLADFGLKVGEPTVDRAISAALTRRTVDGCIDLGAGAAQVLGNALVVRALNSFGVEISESKGVLDWLVGHQRADGGWADDFEIAGTTAPSVIGTTAAALYALVGVPGRVYEEARRRARQFLLRHAFEEYNGRFAPKSFWEKTGWPQYNYDVVYVARTLIAGGASPDELSPFVAKIFALRSADGFWRHHLPAANEYWFRPVRAGRASRWVTYFAACVLKWLAENGPRGK